MPHALRCDRPEHLVDPEFLGRLVGPVRHVEQTPMGTPGFSGSTHMRLEATLVDGSRVEMVLKHTRLDTDWMAYRTHDSLGREAMLLSSPELAGVWDVFESPYLAYATPPGEAWLLMRDVGAHLLPDVREPIALETEDALLARLAHLHAFRWGAASWPDGLSRHAHALALIGPVLLGEDPDPPPPPPMRERVVEGWTEALRRLPAAAARLLRLPAAEHERRYAHLPRALVHGDVKVANFAFLPGGRVAAFDWALAASAPATVDLGWYLAVNASRLARPRDAFVARYRALLETALGRSVDEPTWSALMEAAIVTGALMLLWSKALAVRDGRPGAEAEWEWWVERLPNG